MPEVLSHLDEIAYAVDFGFEVYVELLLYLGYLSNWNGMQFSVLLHGDNPRAIPSSAMRRYRGGSVVRCGLVAKVTGLWRRVSDGCFCLCLSL